MISATKKFSFEAAHHLPGHQGACKNLHGHRYELEVTISGDVDLNSGMIMDFSLLKEIVNEVIIQKYDHSYLNDFFINPTAERMVMNFAQDLEKAIGEGISLIKVRLYETANSFVEWNKDK